MNRNVTNPQQAQWGDMDPSEKTARLLSGVIGGAGKGFQNYQQQGQQMKQSQGMPGQMQGPSYNGPLYSTSNLPGKNPIFYGGS